MLPAAAGISKLPLSFGGNCFGHNNHIIRTEVTEEFRSVVLAADASENSDEKAFTHGCNVVKTCICCKEI